MLEACDGCEISKEKACAVRNKTYTRATNPGEWIFLDMTGALPESLICNHYWIGTVDNCRRYIWSFFTKIKLKLPKKLEDFFEKWRHRVLQISTYIVIIPGNTNKNCRRCVKKKNNIGLNYTSSKSVEWHHWKKIFSYWRSSVGYTFKWKIEQHSSENVMDRSSTHAQMCA